jgi:proline racemase
MAYPLKISAVVSVLTALLYRGSVAQRIAKVRQSLDSISGFQEVQAPICKDNRHMETVSLAAVGTAHLYPGRYRWYSVSVRG